MEGFQEFEARRRKKFDKQIDSNVMMNTKGLEQGVDSWTWRPVSNMKSDKVLVRIPVWA